jgi:hypothetical protein
MRYDRRGGLWLVDPTPIFDARFTELPTGAVTQAQLATLGWTSTRSTGGAYVQTSASTLLGGIAADQARMQELTETKRGLLNERASTTYILRSRALATTALGAGNWLLPGALVPVYTDSLNSPISGLSDARRIQVAAGGYSYYAFVSTGTPAGHVVCSLWRRAHSGTLTHQWGGGQNPVAPYVIDSSTATTTWEHRYFTDAHDGATAFYLGPALGGTFGVGDVSLAQDVHVDAVQLESGRIPTSFIAITVGSTASRGADVLTSTVAAGATMPGAGNRLSARIKGIALGPISHMAGTVCVFDFVSSGGVHNTLTIEPSTRIATVAWGGGSGSFAFPVAVPDCARGDDVSFWLATDTAGVSTLKVRVNASVTNCGSSGALGPCINVAPAQMSVCGRGATQTLDFMLTRFSTYSPGDVPAEFQ